MKDIKEKLETLLEKRAKFNRQKAERNRQKQEEERWKRLTQTVLRPWSHIDESMIYGPNAFLGDTRRALAQRPEFVKKRVEAIAREIIYSNNDDILSRLDIKTRVLASKRVRQLREEQDT